VAFSGELLFLVPSTLDDFVVRLAIGTDLAAVAIRCRADWLAFTAAAIAVPTLWGGSPRGTRRRPADAPRGARQPRRICR
jgi:hypothetical protein